MNLGEQYRQSWHLIRHDLRRFYKICIIVCLILVLYLMYYLSFSVSVDTLQDFLDSHAFQMKVARNDVLMPDWSGTWYGVFLQNALVDLLLIAIGLIPAIYLPMGGVMILGIGTGVMVPYTAKIMGVKTLNCFAACFLPHGVIEFAVNLLACTCGMYICAAATRQMRGYNADGVMRETVLRALRIYVSIILPVLLIASLIEAGITPLAVQSLIAR